MIETIAPLNCLGPIRLDEMDQGLASSTKKDFLLRLRQNLQAQHLGVKSGLARQILHIERCFCQVNLAIVGVGHGYLLVCFVVMIYITSLYSLFSKKQEKQLDRKSLLRKLRRGVFVDL